MRSTKQGSRLGRAVLGLGLGLLAACGGYPDGLVVVRVSGLVSSITALQVAMKLDEATAKNPTPPRNQPDTSFVVSDDLQRFGVQVPAGTRTLCLCVRGSDTNLQVVRSGTAVLGLSAGHEVAVTLSEGTACDVAMLVCAAD